MILLDMANRRLVVVVSLLAGLGVVLGGIAVLKGKGGHRNAGLATGKESLGVEEGPAPAGVTRGLRPVNGGADTEVPGRYVVKFDRHGKAGAKLVAGKLTATDPVISATLGKFKSAKGAYTFAPADPLGASLGMTQTFEVQSDEDLATLRSELEGKGSVEWVDAVHTMSTLTTPNDQYYSLQWDLQYEDIPAVEGIADGTNVIVAVVDSGVSVGPDGYAHYGAGYDLVDNDADASDADGAAAGFSHGTHVAATIAETTNNSMGAAGIAPGVTIMPVRVMHLDASSGEVTGSDTTIASGIVWAVDHGADVINLSVGGPAYSAELADACDYAHEAGVVVVAASGNDGYTNGVIYPAALPTVIAVGAVDRSHVVTYYSNEGPELDIVAPGGDSDQDVDHDGNGDGILQESFGANGWQFFIATGTSMASPHVAAAAALLIAHGYTDPDDVYDALTSSATDLGTAQRDNVYGYGELNILAALQLSVPKHDSGDNTEPASGDNGGSGGSSSSGGNGGGTGTGSQTTQPLALTDILASQAAEGHLSITWHTSIPASTELSGGGGSYKDDTLVTSHTVVATGTVGQKITFDLRSASADGQAAVGTVDGTFEPATQTYPLNSGNCATGGAEAAWSLALLGMALSMRRRA